MYDTGPQTLRDLLQESARDFSSRTALAMIDGPAVTYAELYRRSAAISEFLKKSGIATGDRVAILGENSPSWGIAYFSIVAMGAVAVPILTDFQPSDIARIVRHAGARALFVSRRFFEKIGELSADERGATILLDDFSIVLPGVQESTLDSSGTRPSTLTVDSSATAQTTVDIKPDDLAAIVYTSGTTGHSKGVMLSHRNLLTEAKATMMITDLDANDRLLSILPLPHTYESTLGLVTPLMIGATIYYLEKPPTAAVLLPALVKIRPTVMLSVPLIIEKIFKGKILPELTSTPARKRLYATPFFRKILNRIAGKKLMSTFGGKLKLFTIGGAPLAPDVEFFLREAKFPYAIGYGLTETSPMVSGSDPSKTRYRASGSILPGAQIRIDNPHPVTGEGEIQIKGPMVMQGYYRDPERTSASFTADGWLKTGDLGIVDVDKYVFIKGRLKNMILGPSGKNIYPEEIESIINEFDTVRESVVFEQGNRLVALVHLDYERLQSFFHSINETDIRAKANAMLADLHKQINERVPLYARIHRIIEQSEPFQKTATQKIKRHLYVP
jgi:long-chain acyl-CoA synthetase